MILEMLDHGTWCLTKGARKPECTVFGRCFAVEICDSFMRQRCSNRLRFVGAPVAMRFAMKMAKLLLVAEIPCDFVCDSKNR